MTTVEDGGAVERHARAAATAAAGVFAALLTCPGQPGPADVLADVDREHLADVAALLIGRQARALLAAVGGDRVAAMAAAAAALRRATALAADLCRPVPDFPPWTPAAIRGGGSTVVVSVGLAQRARPCGDCGRALLPAPVALAAAGDRLCTSCAAARGATALVAAYEQARAEIATLDPVRDSARIADVVAALRART